MLLDDNGFIVGAFDPILASLLGNAKGEEGCKVLAEAITHQRSQVALRDWLYVLLKAPTTEVHKRLIGALGKKPEKLVDGIEAGVDEEETPMGMPPDRLTAQTVAKSVLLMLDAAEHIAREFGCRNINDVVLTLALWEVADKALQEALTLWATEDGIRKFLTHLHTKLGPPPTVEVFDKDGNLIPKVFAPSGRRFCQRLAEDAASLGAKKITARHMLYTLLGNESGLLATALAVRGIDVKKEMHATLSRELAKPGKKRNEGFTVCREAVFDAVEQVLKDSAVGARRRGAKGLAEFDICRSFVALQAKELARLFPSGHPLDPASLKEYLEAAEPEEEEEKSGKRFTVKQIEDNMKKRVCGQEAAIDRVLPWVKRLRFGLPRDGRPAAVFLFLGPTGSGKTQLAKELARYVFGEEEMMIFLEMGQFKTKESMSAFIGAPPGYVGYGEGKLTNGLGDKPESVVLFDEIEKADTQVFDVLLRFADEGLISDPAGPVRDGRKCIIVMTTNAGQAWLRDHLKSTPAVREESESLARELFEAAMAELQQKGFRPEFLGRVDERISFLPFTLETCRKIVDGVLERELDKFKKLKGITIEVPDDVRNVLARKAYDRSGDEGARGAPRAVNEFIVTPAIDKLTRGESEEEDSEQTHLIASVRDLDHIVVEFAEEGSGTAPGEYTQFNKPAEAKIRV